MSNQSIFTLKQNGNRTEQLACHVLDKNGIHTINDLNQFITEYKNWLDLMERFKEMGPVKLEAVKEMVKRLGK